MRFGVSRFSDFSPRLFFGRAILAFTWRESPILECVSMAAVCGRMACWAALTRSPVLLSCVGGGTITVCPGGDAFGLRSDLDNELLFAFVMYFLCVFAIQACYSTPIEGFAHIHLVQMMLRDSPHAIQGRFPCLSPVLRLQCALAID